MKKHAFIVLAHTNQPQIEQLVSILDSDRVDIFLHVDSKYKGFDQQKMASVPKKSSIFFGKRMDIRWGDYSQCELELQMMNLARKNGPYCYYHIISAMDLPTRPVGQFLDFCEEHQGTEFVRFEPDKFSRIDVCVYRPFRRHQRPSNKFARFVMRRLIKLITRTQLLLGVNRFPDINFMKGSNWISVTEDAIDAILEKEGDYRRIYLHSTCCDEKFVQTTLGNDERFKRKFYQEKGGNMRLVDWKRGRPYTFRLEDYEEIASTEMFWVRKIDWNVDKNISDKIISTLI